MFNQNNKENEKQFLCVGSFLLAASFLLVVQKTRIGPVD